MHSNQRTPSLVESSGLLITIAVSLSIIITVISEKYWALLYITVTHKTDLFIRFVTAAYFSLQQLQFVFCHNTTSEDPRKKFVFAS